MKKIIETEEEELSPAEWMKEEGLTKLKIDFVNNLLAMPLGERRSSEGKVKALTEAGYVPGKKGGKCFKSAVNFALWLLRQPEVDKYKRKREKEIADAAGVSPEYILTNLKEIVEKTMKEKQYKAANTALATMCKVLGIDRKSIDVNASGLGFGLVLHMDGRENKSNEQ